VGGSEGGLLVTMMAEQHPLDFDGALAMCGPVGGMPYQVDYVGDFRVIFDYFFPDVFTFDMADVLDLPPTPYDTAFLQWQSTYLPAIEKAIKFHPLKAAQLFNITGTAVDVFHPETFVAAADTLLFYNIWGTADMVDKAGGMPYDNQDVWYPGSWLLNHRVERVDENPDARQYVQDFYEPTGNLKIPVVALHTLFDPAVPYRHEEIYRKRVAAMGNAENFSLLPVFAYGHCNFKPWQVLGAFYLLLGQAAQ
jgi:pimeloyl-ACP methyl ester carboxylesterase